MPSNDQSDIRNAMEQQRRDIADIKDKVDGLTEVTKVIPGIQSTLSHMSGALDKLVEWKDGSGEKPSIEVRMDRIEQKQKLAFWVFGTIGGVFLTSGTIALIYVLARVVVNNPPSLP